MAIISAPEKTTYVAQGEVAIDDHPDAVITTLLGSCVSVCLHDPLACVGGMNHILLPVEDDSVALPGAAVHSMECLINPLMQMGAKRSRLQAKVFGGARFSGAMGNIGQANVAFALKFLESEGIALLGKSTGGESARKIRFWPATGRAKQKLVHEAPEIEQPKADSGADVELF